jgi:hypothetical protein
VSCSYKQNESSWVKREISSAQTDDFTFKVKPILDKRCVVCHSCYNSPCQLNLASHEGFERGASKKDIYDFNTLKAQDMTRLFEDAQTAKDWYSDYNFFPIISRIKDQSVDLETSTLHHMLEMKSNSSLEIKEYNSEKSRSCPEVNQKYYGHIEIDEYKRSTPWAGMPYGFPKLKEEELTTLYDWLSKGAPGPIQKNEIDSNTKEIKKWEKFFNKKSNKHQVSARYLYEHLFIAHIYFNDNIKSYYRIVRAKNLTGAPQVIPTRRPYNSPKTKNFYYRFKKITSTIVHKTHIVYKFDSQKFKRYHDLFIKSDWGDEKIVLPSYKLKTSANPLKTFRQIPAKSRYQFLLDNAHYHVQTFIRGPVCKGQVALNVIDDHFWTMFVDPDSDVFVNHPDALDALTKWSTTPAQYGSNINFKAASSYKQSFSDKYKARIIKNNFLNQYLPNSLSVNDIWDGDGNNDNALLTIYRHFDSSSVLKGAHGNYPKTVWVLDYPTLEDIYYNLVAGYDVFGAASHQLKTRVHMDNSRINSQDNFIDMLPLNRRAKVRYDWSRSQQSEFNPKNIIVSPKDQKKIDKVVKEGFKYLDAAKKMDSVFPYLGAKRQNSMVFKSDDVKKELLDKFFSSRLNFLFTGGKTTINRNNSKGKIAKSIDSYNEFEKEAKKAFGKKGSNTQYFPDLSLVRIHDNGTNNRIYTLIRNKAHWNVSYLLKESLRRREKEDTLNLLPGFVGSYPNFVFKVDFKDLSNFLHQIKEMKNEKGYKRFLKLYGVSRISSQFWDEFDFIGQHFKKTKPLEAGVLDLNRYLNQ